MTDLPQSYQPEPPYDPTRAIQYPPVQSAPPKKRKVWPWIVGGLAVMVLLCCGIGVIGNLAGGDTDKSAKPAALLPTSAKPVTPSATTAAPPTTKAAPPPAPPKPVKVAYKTLSEREWKLIAKNPDAYSGKTYVVYGVVTQFDAATGDDGFRADVGHKNMAEDYEYQTNTVLTGQAAMLANLVEGDEFRANVSVLGSYSYDTQIGGNTVAPSLSIAAIKVL